MAEEPSNPTLPACPTPLPEGRTRLGRYRVERLLGRGAMGVVYEGQTEDGAPVALKVLPGWVASQGEGLRRFLREAQAAACVKHPNVVAVHEAGQDGDIWFLALELVPGGSLHDRMRTSGPLPWREATRALAQACRGLAAVHEAGIVHRDVKPGNILLGADGSAKLADFGLARLDSAEYTPLTVQGAMLGTPAYMSPEQCKLQKADERSDVYAMGATYYALLTGRPPYEGESPVQMMFAHCALDPPDPRARADVPVGCTTIIRRAMARDPAARYPSAPALANALEALLAGVQPETPPDLVIPLNRRTRRWLLAGGGVLASLAFFFWYTGFPDRWQARWPVPGQWDEPPPPIPPNRFLERLAVKGGLKTEAAVRSIAIQLPRWLALGMAGTGVTVWDLIEEKIHCRLWADARVGAIALSPDGRLLAASGRDGVLLHDLTAGRDLPLPVMESRPATSLVFASGEKDTSFLMAALSPWPDGTCTLRYWDVDTGNFHDIDGQHSRHVILAASPNRTQVASVSSTDHWIRVWQGDDRMRKVITRGPGSALAWSPDGRTVAAANGKVVEFYDLRTGSRVDGQVTDEALIRGVAFAPNGRLVTIGEATRIRERGGGVLVKEWRTSDPPSIGLALTPDGRTLLTCDGQQKLVRVLSVADWCA